MSVWRDKDHYPTEAAIARIEAWPRGDLDGLLTWVRDEVWRWGESYVTEHKGEWTLVTGGWSGNEDVIEAIARNKPWWHQHWIRTTRGGMYEFSKGAPR